MTKPYLTLLVGFTQEERFELTKNHFQTDYCVHAHPRHGSMLIRDDWAGQITKVIFNSNRMHTDFMSCCTMWHAIIKNIRIAIYKYDMSKREITDQLYTDQILRNERRFNTAICQQYGFQDAEHFRLRTYGHLL